MVGLERNTISAISGTHELGVSPHAEPFAFIAQELPGASGFYLEKASRLWYQSLGFKPESRSDTY